MSAGWGIAPSKVETCSFTWWLVTGATGFRLEKKWKTKVRVTWLCQCTHEIVTYVEKRKIKSTVAQQHQQVKIEIHNMTHVFSCFNSEDMCIKHVCHLYQKEAGEKLETYFQVSTSLPNVSVLAVAMRASLPLWQMSSFVENWRRKRQRSGRPIEMRSAAGERCFFDARWRQEITTFNVRC